MIPIAPIGAVSKIESTAIIKAISPYSTLFCINGVVPLARSNANEPSAAYK